MERLSKFAKKAFNRSNPDDKKNANSNSTDRVVKKKPPTLPPKTKEGNATELETDFKKHKFSYTWRIKNIHLCNLKSGEFLQSPPFSTRFCGEITWALWIYINQKKGNFSDSQSQNSSSDEMESELDMFGLFLHRISNHPVNAYMRYRFICDRPSRIEIHCFPSGRKSELIDLKSTDKSEYGTDYFFLRQRSEGPETVVLGCDIYIIGVFNMGVPGNCDVGTLKSDTLINDFQEILETGNFSDVTLQAKDEEFRAHKSILASRSQVFAAMFQHDMLEARSNIIQVEDIEPEVLRSLLQYIYTGRIEDFDIEKAMSLYAASDKYLLAELKKWCTDMMLRHMTVENACRIAVLADMHPDPELKDAALYMIRNHSSDFFKRKEWDDLVKDANHNRLVSEILAYVSSDFITDCENK